MSLYTLTSFILNGFKHTTIFAIETNNNYYFLYLYSFLTLLTYLFPTQSE